MVTRSFPAARLSCWDAIGIPPEAAMLAVVRRQQALRYTAEVLPVKGAGD